MAASTSLSHLVAMISGKRLLQLKTHVTYYHAVPLVLLESVVDIGGQMGRAKRHSVSRT